MIFSACSPLPACAQFRPTALSSRASPTMGSAKLLKVRKLATEHGLPAPAQPLEVPRRLRREAGGVAAILMHG